MGFWWNLYYDDKELQSYAAHFEKLHKLCYKIMQQVLNIFINYGNMSFFTKFYKLPFLQFSSDFDGTSYEDKGL